MPVKNDAHDFVVPFNKSTCAQKLCFASEIGLSGELRPISKTNQRIQEAEKLGFEGIFISSYTKFSSQQNKIKLHQLSKVESLVNFLF